jgi:uncharacterized membrane protein
VLDHGHRAITNDAVNIICTLVGALASALFLYLFIVAIGLLMGKGIR